MTIKQGAWSGTWPGCTLPPSPGAASAVDFDSGIGQVAPGSTEVVLAALASCSAMDVISILAKKRQPFDGYEIRFGDQRDGYPQVFTRIDDGPRLEGPNLDVAAVRRSIELSATKYCPVIAMLAAGATESTTSTASSAPGGSRSTSRARWW